MITSPQKTQTQFSCASNLSSDRHLPHTCALISLLILPVFSNLGLLLLTQYHVGIYSLSFLITHINIRLGSYPLISFSVVHSTQVIRLPLNNELSDSSSLIVLIAFAWATFRTYITNLFCVGSPRLVYGVSKIR